MTDEKEIIQKFYRGVTSYVSVIMNFSESEIIINHK